MVVAVVQNEAWKINLENSVPIFSSSVKKNIQVLKHKNCHNSKE